MIEDQINWDKHFAKLTWNEVYKNSPFFDGQRLPTLFSPDGSKVYVSSLDLEFSTSEAGELLQALDDIKAIFDTAKRSNRYYKMAMAKSDFVAVQGLLPELGVDGAGHLIIEGPV